MKNKSTIATPRACGTCTACCDGWVTMNVHGHKVLPGAPCPYSRGTYCTIYDDRPVDPCRYFICAWLREPSHLPDWFRPDQAKVIVLVNVRSWRSQPVDVAVPVGKRIPGKALNWLKIYASQFGRPLIYTEQAANKPVREQLTLGFGPPEFQQDIQALVHQGKKLW